MRRNEVRSYVVEGSLHGSFPVDMLRYDCAWPTSQADVGRLGDSLDREARHDLRERGQKTIKVSLSSIQDPTVERWESFGWKVLLAGGLGWHTSPASTDTSKPGAS